MKPALILSFVLLPIFCQAGSKPQSTGKCPPEETPTASRWSYGAAFSSIMGLRARFSGLGGFSNAAVLPPVGGGRDYDYDDGYVHVDSSNNAGGRTWNWGYDNAEQYDPANGGAIRLSVFSGLADASVSESGESAPGVEFFALYEAGRLPFSLPGADGGLQWGLKFGLGLHSASIGNRDALAVTATRITDTFALNGVVPEVSPWNGGSFSGPGPRISDSPTRSTSVAAGGSTISGMRELDVFLSSASAGAFVSIPISQRLTAALEAGVTLAVASADYGFQSTVSLPGTGTQTRAGYGESTALLPGIYLGTSLTCEINETVSIVGSLRYQYLKSMDVHTATSSAELDFGSAFVGSIGLLFRF